MRELGTRAIRLIRSLQPKTFWVKEDLERSRMLFSCESMSHAYYRRLGSGDQYPRLPATSYLYSLCTKAFNSLLNLQLGAAAVCKVSDYGGFLTPMSRALRILDNGSSLEIPRT